MATRSSTNPPSVARWRFVPASRGDKAIDWRYTCRSTSTSDPNVSPYDLAALWSQGDAVIKIVALLLLLMSIALWWLIVTRTWRLMELRRAAKAATAFWHAKSFDQGLRALRAPGTPVADLNPFRHLALEDQAAVAHHEGNQEKLHGQL